MYGRRYFCWSPFKRLEEHCLLQVDLLDKQGTGRVAHSRPALLEGRGEVHQWLILLLAGSVAGTLSGVMGGLTAIDGPPTIFMFNVLAAGEWRRTWV